MRKMAVVLLLAWSSAAAAEAPEPVQHADCAAAIATAERSGDIPADLLAAIARVESGRPGLAGGATQPWPWTIDVGGNGRFFATKAEAIAATAVLQKQGIASIDVGCLQVNLASHPAAFAGLEEAFDPLANALYAARFLRLLFNQTGDWPAAIAAYHSQTHEIGAAYQGKVLAIWTPTASAEPSPAASRPLGLDPANWTGAGSGGANRWSAAVDGRSVTWQPNLPSTPSPAIERLIAAVASCPMPTETSSPLSAAAEVAPVWKGSGGTCPTSPFAKPAALRRLLVEP
jgi:Transglycosylase SLT domain